MAHIDKKNNKESKKSGQKTKKGSNISKTENPIK